MPNAQISKQAEQRMQIQGKRIRMARAAMDISLMDFAEMVSRELGQRVSHELLRRLEHGDRDAEYALLRAIAAVVADSIATETSTPLGWLAGGGEPTFVNPG